MATTAITFSNEYLSSTLYVLAKEWRDNLGVTTALIDEHERVHGQGGVKQDGGTRYVCGLGLGEHSSATRHQTGYEKRNLDVQDVLVPAVYTPAHTTMPVAISKDEEMKNKGESAIISIMEARAESTLRLMRRRFLRRIATGEPVAGFEDWNHLNGITYTDGFLEHDAVGSQTNSVGGVNKTTYQSTPGWQNQRFNCASSFNTNGLPGMQDVGVEVDAVASGGGNHLWLASRAGAKNLKRALRTYERYVDQEKLDGGRLVEMWDGIRIAVEYYMPTNTTVHSTAAISFYLLCLDDIHFMFDSEGYFDTSDFEKVSGEYDVRVATIRLYGQLVAKHLGSSGIVYDAETF